MCSAKSLVGGVCCPSRQRVKQRDGSYGRYVKKSVSQIQQDEDMYFQEPEKRG